MKRVLVVDDEAMNRDVLRKILHKEGLEVLEAGNGAEAVKLLQSSEVSLVLLDLMMPVMDGFATIEAIRSNTDYDALPVIVITAYKEPSAWHRALGMGADTCIAKPFDLPVLVETLRRTLREGRNAFVLEESVR